MTTKNSRRATPHRISGPGELLQAVPYLLGFHPRQSLVLVGLAAGQLVVTARIDLVDAEAPAVVADTIRTLVGGGSRELVAAIYLDDPVAESDEGTLPGSELAAVVATEADTAGCELVDVLLVSARRWWSYLCGVAECCPPEGRELPVEPSAFAAAATVAGVVALPDRAALAAGLDPLPAPDRERLAPLIVAAENAGVAAVLDDRPGHHERSVKRAIFAAARASGAPRWCAPSDTDVARFGVALGETSVRDSVWMAIDGGRLDGRALWRELARRLPAPYDAPALFLFGWCSWRAGDGALANIAADRTVKSNPRYSAADLLLAALNTGVDPRRMPKLRLPRSA